MQLDMRSKQIRGSHGPRRIEARSVGREKMVQRAEKLPEAAKSLGWGLGATKAKKQTNKKRNTGAKRLGTNFPLIFFDVPSTRANFT